MTFSSAIMYNFKSPSKIKIMNNLYLNFRFFYKINQNILMTLSSALFERN